MEIIYIYSEKERKRLKRFVSSTVNERVDLDTFSSKRMKSIKKRKEKKERRKKERKEKRKKERHLCLTLLAWLNKADSLKEKKERRKKERKEKKEERETFVFKTVCWFNIAGTLKRKKEKRNELFLKPHNYLFGRHLLKFCCILTAPLC